jgi:hypothetical protein
MGRKPLQRWFEITARFSSACVRCNALIGKGDTARLSPDEGIRRPGDCTGRTVWGSRSPYKRSAGQPEAGRPRTKSPSGAARP